MIFLYGTPDYEQCCTEVAEYHACSKKDSIVYIIVLHFTLVEGNAENSLAFDTKYLGFNDGIL